MDRIQKLEQLLAQGQDNPMVRFGLGAAHLEAGHFNKAIEHLAVAISQQHDYSAAWKLYAKALTASGDRPAAMRAYEEGIRRAREKGDIQAAREMEVFLKRLQRSTG